MEDPQKVAVDPVTRARGDGREYSTEKNASAPLTVFFFGKLIGFPIKYFVTPLAKKE